MYQIRNTTSGEPLNFRIHDTRGIEADQGIDAHEMCFLLDGHIPDRHQVAIFINIHDIEIKQNRDAKLVRN